MFRNRAVWPLLLLPGVGLLTGVGLLGCSAGQTGAQPPSSPSSPTSEAAADADSASSAYDGPSYEWAPQTYSPRPGSAEEPELEALTRACGRGDAALHQVARIIAELQLERGQSPGLDEVQYHMRRLGSPYVMPRLWAASMAGVSEEQVVAHVAGWAKAQAGALGEVYCGAGRAEGADGVQVVAVLQVDVLAHLQALPTQAEVSSWIDFEAAFVNPPTAAQVILLPPEGAPKTIQTALDGGSASARFSLDAPGTWLIQLMSTQSGGPRPVASALITAGERPPGHYASQPVPGEAAFDPTLRADDALFQLINGARTEAGLPPVARDRQLDKVAQAHSQAMAKAGRISHDTGLGDPAFRTAEAGIELKATGENVALAQSVPRLHRVLWASPSHRQNILLRRWDTVGVAVIEGEDGSLYATQLFGDR